MGQNALVTKNGGHEHTHVDLLLLFTSSAVTLESDSNTHPFSFHMNLVVLAVEALWEWKIENVTGHTHRHYKMYLQ